MEDIELWIFSQSEADYGEILSFSLYIRNSGDKDISLYFDGNGNSFFDIRITLQNISDPIYIPNNIETYNNAKIIIQPNQDLLFTSFSWNLFETDYSKRIHNFQSNLASPGIYDICWTLYLDQQYHNEKNLSINKSLKINNISSESINLIATISDIPFYPTKSVIIGNYYNNSIIIDYYPEYSFSSVNETEITYECRVYNNGFYFIKIIKNSVLNFGLVKNNSHKKITFDIPCISCQQQISICLIDEIASSFEFSIFFKSLFIENYHFSSKNSNNN